MNNVALNEQTMQDAAMKIQGSADEIQNKLNAISSRIDEISNSWQDDNARKFLEKFQELQGSFPKCYNDACKLSHFLSGVVKAYREQVFQPTATAVRGTDSTNA